MEERIRMPGGAGKIPGLLLSWYDQNRRRLPWREEIVPYHTWLSEIMLQQTRVEAVIPYYQRFLAELPDIPALAAAPEGRLYKLWEGLGYYSRVRNMQKAARVICEQYRGMLPADYDLLCGLPGIGAYTAGAIASIAFGLPVPAVDGNVLRVLSRVTACGEDIMAPKVRSAFQALAARLLPQDRPGDFNQALMELGATVCLPNGAPLCGGCPFAPCCRALEEGSPRDYPVKAAKKPRRVVLLTVVLLGCGDRVYLTKRPAKGLLGGLWQPWLIDGHFDGGQALRESLEQSGIRPTSLRWLGKARHVFTHLEWEMQGYWADLAAPPPLDGGEWVTARQILQNHAVPGAFKAFFTWMKEGEDARAVGTDV